MRTSTSTSSNSFTRIAQNFMNGVRLAQQGGADIVVLVIMTIFGIAIAYSDRPTFGDLPTGSDGCQ